MNEWIRLKCVYSCAGKTHKTNSTTQTGGKTDPVFPFRCTFRQVCVALGSLFLETLLIAVYYSQQPLQTSSAEYKVVPVTALLALSAVDSPTGSKMLHSSFLQCVPDSLESLSLCSPTVPREKHLRWLNMCRLRQRRQCVAETLANKTPQLYPGRVCAHINSPVHCIGPGVNKISGANPSLYPRRHLRVNGCDVHVNPEISVLPIRDLYAVKLIINVKYL